MRAPARSRRQRSVLPRQRFRASHIPWLEKALNEGSHARIGIVSCAVPHIGVEATVTETEGVALLTAGRIFVRADESACSVGECVSANVQWRDAFDTADVMDAAKSRSRAVELTARELGPLVQRWLDLCHNAVPDLGDALDFEVAALGELPGIDRPSDRALYCAALLNPFGCRLQAAGGDEAATWPALEVRGSVLTAATVTERLTAVKTGLVDSIYKLKGGKWPMRSYYWQ